MSTPRFLLAVPVQQAAPTGPREAAGIAAVGRIGQVLGEAPQIWCDAGAPRIDLGGAGLVIGALFDRQGCTPVRAFADGALDTLRPAWLARRLVLEYWGAYLALLRDPVTGTLHAMPDPSGLLPVYRFQTGTHAILTSDLALLVEVGIAGPRPAWPQLAAHLRWPELRWQATCLVGVTELTPGTLVPLGGGDGEGQAIWHPGLFMPGEVDICFEEAAESLRDLAVLVIGAWVRHFGRVAVAASGGVDSSFICAALRRGGYGFGCITLATSDPSGDERRFVCRLAEHLGAPWQAALYDADLIDLARPASGTLPRPQRKAFMQALDAALGRAAGDMGADVVLDGNGGDNLFCFLHSAAPVADSLRLRGAGAATLTTFLDMCRLTDCDVWTMARAVLGRLIQQPASDLWAADERLLTDAGTAPLEVEPLTPWLGVDFGRHLGKRDHLALIMRCQNHLHTLAGPVIPRRFSPLMSQPLLERCLSLPTWLWSTGGINRALARAAFASDLPAEIATRTSKSGPDSFIRRLFDLRRGKVRGRLMDGLLREHDLIDARAVEAALSVSAETGGPIIYRLLDLVEAEAWARSWGGGWCG